MRRPHPPDVALRMGIPVAIAPDWTWSGSINPAREKSLCQGIFAVSKLRVHRRDLWAMTTSEAARAVGLDGVIGSLAEGMMAFDIAVYEYSETPYQPIVDGEPTSTILTVVHGKALYGHPDLMGPLVADNALCEAASACEEDRLFCVRETTYDSGYTDLETDLQTALDQENVGEGYASKRFVGTLVV